MEKRANTLSETDIFLQNLGADLRNNAALYGGLTLGATGLAGILSAVRPRKPGESKRQRVRRTINNMLRTGLGTAGALTAYSAATNLSGLGEIDPANVVETESGRLETPPPVERSAWAIGKDISTGAGALGLAGIAGNLAGRSLWDMGESQVSRIARTDPKGTMRRNLGNSQTGQLAGQFVGRNGRAVIPKDFTNTLLSASDILPNSSPAARLRALYQLYGTATGGADELSSILRDRINRELAAEVAKAGKNNPRITLRTLSTELRDNAVRRAIIDSVGAGDSPGEAIRRTLFGSTGRGELHAGRAGNFLQRNTAYPKGRKLFSRASALGIPLIWLLGLLDGDDSAPSAQ